MPVKPPAKTARTPGKDKPRAYRSPSREAAAEDTRARIVDGALVLLAGGPGLPAFSMDAAARQAGVTRLTVYNQFESRSGLLEAAFDEMARRGGLHEIAEVFAEPDADAALRRLVGIFCRFWSMHGKVLPRFSALMRLDEEVAASLKQRAERRRVVLAQLVLRLLPRQAKADQELVDLLFALTGFEMFDALSVHRRSAAAVEKLVLGQVEQAVRMHRS